MNITVILNCYRRPYYIREQLDAIKNQSVAPSEIWLWINDHEDNKDWNFDDYGFDCIVRSNHNFKFHGRFSLACLARTKYVALFDDDTIPGKDWFKNCLDSQNKLGPCILGGVGLIFNSAVYWDHVREGWPSKNEDIKEVDLVGHAWFFPREVMRFFWIDTLSLDNCEDLQLSYNAKKYAGVKTYCPPHPESNKDMWSSLQAVEKGEDSKASSNGGIPLNIFYGQRNYCVQAAIKNGWKTLKDLKV